MDFGVFGSERAFVAWVGRVLVMLGREERGGADPLAVRAGRQQVLAQVERFAGLVQYPAATRTSIAHARRAVQG